MIERMANMGIEILSCQTGGTIEKSALSKDAAACFIRG